MSLDRHKVKHYLPSVFIRVHVLYNGNIGFLRMVPYTKKESQSFIFRVVRQEV